jgi:hypothetical protein
MISISSGPPMPSMKPRGSAWETMAKLDGQTGKK